MNHLEIVRFFFVHADCIVMQKDVIVINNQFTRGILNHDRCFQGFKFGQLTEEILGYSLLDFLVCSHKYSKQKV